LVVQLAPNVLVVISKPTEPPVTLALLVLLLLKDLSFPLIVLPVKKDGLLDMPELLNAPSALIIPMKSTEPLASLVTLDLLLSITLREKKNAEPALKDLLLKPLILLAVPSALLEPMKPVELLVILALQVLIPTLKDQLNASHAFLEPTVILKEMLVLFNAKLVTLATIPLSPDKVLAKDALLVLMKRTELPALTALLEATLLLEPLNVSSVLLVLLLTTMVPLCARSAPLTPMKRAELNVLLAKLVISLMMEPPLASPEPPIKSIISEEEIYK
jgi:hypothetical protein